jgi:hypothetical protein
MYLFVSPMEAQQPVPLVTRDDVERVVQRDYEPREHASALAILTEYAPDGQASEHARVHLAALKLAAGDIAELRARIDSAKLDFRDVLLAAEYPGAGAIGWTDFEKLTIDHQQRIHDADWDQYVQWLGRPAHRRRDRDDS